MSFSGRVKDIEKVVKRADSTSATDLDIELDKFVIEVTGGGKGTVGQIQNKIQPNTNKEVILFAPNLKTSVMKELDKANINAFTDPNDLLKVFGRSK